MGTQKCPPDLPWPVTTATRKLVKGEDAETSAGREKGWRHRGMEGKKYPINCEKGLKS